MSLRNAGDGAAHGVALGVEALDDTGRPAGSAAAALGGLAPGEARDARVQEVEVPNPCDKAAGYRLRLMLTADQGEPLAWTGARFEV